MTYAFSAVEWVRDITPDPATAATRFDVADYDLVVRSHKQLTDDDRAQWAMLSATAGQNNVFAQAWFMDAALASCPDADIDLLIVTHKASGAWIGMLPVTHAQRFGRWPVENWQVWSATNQFLGTALAIAETAPIFWRVILRHLDRNARGAVLLHLRQLAIDDPVIVALITLCDQRNRAFATLNHIRRDARIASPLASQRLNGGGKSLGRLKSLRARLEREHGPVHFNQLPAEEGPTPWIARFLEMERSGWKGKADSALACETGTRQLFETVITRGHADGTAHLATLLAGDTPVAMTSWFTTGANGFGFKMAYDEGFRAYAPGKLLMQHVAQATTDCGIMHFDTCAKPVGRSRNPLWPDKRDIFDCAIVVGSPTQRLIGEAVLRARGLRRTFAGARVALQHMTHF